ncbi:MAG: dephospho-CoA kinase [Betaproteobacteria bacterium RIFCSPLOWO2_02_67_12]|nr:MAG: dephospho-CoA kinase [Betaproteobacteria bacterium RIFCSPLOWO2_02_67_12]OGA27170.1 MAG: dephospho-CoA kinase [Betaproteobacteria bacterium RIFCSPLOWO2_02_FULL_68_150]OGA63649.1 MAG: dephospho-CoA kinase [Betaproteobacteria bacterium RIFCSPLOWO2_12_FULL_67_28]
MSQGLVVGLTGGIGSGKTAAADEFARHGATVVDTDAIAHQLTRPGGAALNAIREQFGPEFLDAAGAMDRTRMRALAFADAAARKKLEALLHPLIRAESERQIEAASGSYVILVVPLLVESPGYRERVSRVLVVDCPEAVQLERVQSRSGLAAEAVHAIIRSQAPRAARIAAADDVIDNSGSLAALHKQVAELHQRYLKQARS